MERMGEKKERPKMLYHASQNPNISEFTPRSDRIRDAEEGPRVFATPERSLASAFLVENHHDGWMSIGYYSGSLVVVLCADREHFIQNDRGGVLYALPSDTFDFDPDKGMGEHEWTSPIAVRPLQQERIPSALDEMVKNGVWVYFVNRKMFEDIKASDDYGASILLKCQSENEYRGQDPSRIQEIFQSWSEE